MNKRKDVIGQVFGRLTVLDNAPDRIAKSGRTSRMVKVKCSCELKTVKEVILSDIKAGKTKSCGCYNLEVSKEKAKKHGLEGISEYTLWVRLFQKCYNISNPQYADYGGRGITVYELWRNNFLAFYNWLKENIGLYPGKPYSLDRIDNNGNYEPGNLRWATPSEQQINKRTHKNNSSGCRGVSWDKQKHKWYAYISKDSVTYSLGFFENIEDAIVARKEAEVKYHG